MLGDIAQGMHEERDLVNQLLGQAQMAGAFEEFSRTVRTSKLAYVKENKLYRAIAGKKSPNGSEFSGTWDEFCSLLGISVDKANMDIANLRTFGEEAWNPCPAWASATASCASGESCPMTPVAP